MRKAKNYVWTAVRVELDLNTSSPILGADIVTAAEWRSAGYETATLLAIRGWLSATPLDGTATEHTSMALITKKSNETAFSATDPNVVATYVDEDILWTGGYTAPNQSEAISRYFDVNVKTKRRITVNDEIRIVFSETTTISPQATRWVGVLRALVNTLS